MRLSRQLALLAAVIFAAASLATNCIYGWGKGQDLPSALVWAGVSAAAGITQLLAWPALAACLEHRAWGKAGTALCALVLCGGYSVVAALGSASGGRTDASITETATTQARARAQRAYDAARAELETLKASRPAAEVEALLAAARPQCRVVVQLGSRQTVCAPPAALTAELGRAQRRAELEARAEAAAVTLAAAPPRVANSDARAVAGYLAAVGLTVETDALNKLLALLAVLTVEMGGGLALTLGMALRPAHLQDLQVVAYNPSTDHMLPEPPAMKTRKKALPAPRGKPSTFADADAVKVLATENPKLEGSRSRARFNLYKKCRTVGDYLDACVRLEGKRANPRGAYLADLRWDVARGFVSVARG